MRRAQASQPAAAPFKLRQFENVPSRFHEPRSRWRPNHTVSQQNEQDEVANEEATPPRLPRSVSTSALTPCKANKGNLAPSTPPSGVQKGTDCPWTKAPPRPCCDRLPAGGVHQHQSTTRAGCFPVSFAGVELKASARTAVQKTAALPWGRPGRRPSASRGAAEASGSRANRQADQADQADLKDRKASARLRGGAGGSVRVGARGARDGARGVQPQPGITLTTAKHGAGPQQWTSPRPHSAPPRIQRPASGLILPNWWPCDGESATGVIAAAALPHPLAEASPN